MSGNEEYIKNVIGLFGEKNIVDPKDLFLIKKSIAWGMWKGIFGFGLHESFSKEIPNEENEEEEIFSDDFGEQLKKIPDESCIPNDYLDLYPSSGSNQLNTLRCIYIGRIILIFFKNFPTKKENFNGQNMPFVIRYFFNLLNGKQTREKTRLLKIIEENKSFYQKLIIFGSSMDDIQANESIIINIYNNLSKILEPNNMVSIIGCCFGQDGFDRNKLIEIAKLSEEFSKTFNDFQKTPNNKSKRKNLEKLLDKFGEISIDLRDKFDNDYNATKKTTNFTFFELNATDLSKTPHSFGYGYAPSSYPPTPFSEASKSPYYAPTRPSFGS